MLNNSQSKVAEYRYDPFGNIISSSGTLAGANVYRFSSKEFHVSSELYYYGYRFYDPNAQRWPNRDPLAETGGINLYAFVRNDSIDRVDLFGLRHWYYGWQAGKLCTSKNCDMKKCKAKYLDEDNWKKGFLNAPDPGKCVSADAVAIPGDYWKIPDNCRVTIECSGSWKDDGTKGKITGLSYICWGWALPVPTPAPVPPFPPTPYP